MWYRFHSPIANVRTDQDKPWHEFKIEENITIEKFFDHLVEAHPEVSPWLRHNAEETFHHMLLFSQSYVLRRTDMIKPDDRLDLMPPLVGG